MEKLFESICIAQATGQDHEFSVMANVFFECFQSYLKPLRAWMDNGMIIPDDGVFFVAMTDQSSERSSLWHDRYVLRRRQDGSLFAPNFLHAAGLKILNTGKSVVFLKELDQRASLNENSVGAEPQLHFDTICSAFDHIMMPPFMDLFHAAFDGWIRSKYSNAVISLKTRIIQQCGLWTSLDALEYLYFSRDGTIFQSFLDNIFEKLDARGRSWTDRFILTELAQETFGSIRSVGIAQLGIRTVGAKGSKRSLRALNGLVVDYSLRWPIANIIRQEAVATYQRIFTLICQVYRAKYVLRVLQLRSTKTISRLGSVEQLEHFLRHRLIWFTDSIHSYLLATVIEPETASMRQRLEAAEDIDAMTAIHAQYISRLEGQCLLSRNLAPIYQPIISILDLCVTFSDVNARDVSDRALSSPQASGASGRSKRLGAAFRREARRATAEDSSDDEDGESSNERSADYDADAESPTPVGRSYEDMLTSMKEQYERLLHFLTAGLRGVSRAGGESCWETLAEKLEWGMQRGVA